MSRTPSCARSASSPPTAGCRSENTAAATAPVIATPNSRKSVRTTERKPPAMLTATVTVEARVTVWSGVSPNITPPILIAASVTAAITMTLKKTPR